MSPDGTTTKKWSREWSREWSRKKASEIKGFINNGTTWTTIFRKHIFICKRAVTHQNMVHNISLYNGVYFAKKVVPVVPFAKKSVIPRLSAIRDGTTYGTTFSEWSHR